MVSFFDSRNPETSMTTLTKENIVKAITKKFNSADFDKDRSKQVLDRLLEIIKRTLENGNDVLISDFGKFCVVKKRERKGRNPATGEDLILAPRRVVRFKCSGKLKEAIDSSSPPKKKKKT